MNPKPGIKDYPFSRLQFLGNFGADGLFILKPSRHTNLARYRLKSTWRLFKLIELKLTAEFGDDRIDFIMNRKFWFPDSMFHHIKILHNGQEINKTGDSSALNLRTIRLENQTFEGKMEDTFRIKWFSHQEPSWLLQVSSILDSGSPILNFTLNDTSLSEQEIHILLGVAFLNLRISFNHSQYID